MALNMALWVSWFWSFSWRKREQHFFKLISGCWLLGHWEPKSKWWGGWKESGVFGQGPAEKMPQWWFWLAAISNDPNLHGLLWSISEGRRLMPRFVVCRVNKVQRHWKWTACCPRRANLTVSALVAFCMFLSFPKTWLLWPDCHGDEPLSCWIWNEWYRGEAMLDPERLRFGRWDISMPRGIPSFLKWVLAFGFFSRLGLTKTFFHKRNQQRPMVLGSSFGRHGPRSNISVRGTGFEWFRAAWGLIFAGAIGCVLLCYVQMMGWKSVMSRRACKFDFLDCKNAAINRGSCGIEAMKQGQSTGASLECVCTPGIQVLWICLWRFTVLRRSKTTLNPPILHPRSLEYPKTECWFLSTIFPYLSGPGHFSWKNV